MDIKTYKGKHTGKEIDEAVNNAPQLKTDVDHLNETMGAYSERESITLVPTATGYVINSNGVKTAKSGWAMAEFTAEKGNVYLFKPGATDGNVCVFAEAITSVETRGIDYTYTYNDDGTIATAVATYGGKTHSYTYTWVDGKATIKEGSTVVSELPMTYTTTVGSYSPLVRLNADAELPMDGYCRYMSHFKGNSAIKVVVSYKVDAADLTMKVTRDGVLASISTQLGNLSQKEDETRAVVEERAPKVWARILATKDCAIKIDDKIVELPAYKNVIVKDFSSVNAYNSEDYYDPKYITNFDIHYNGVPQITAFQLLSGFGKTKDDKEGQWRCMDGVRSLDVSCFDTSKMTYMQGNFRQLRTTSLETLDLSGWDFSNTKNVYMMFSGCRNLKSLYIPNNICFDNVTDHNLSSMFENCSSLTSLDVSGWVTSSVTNMSYMFNYCISLTSLDVSNWDTSSVTNMQSLFSSCSSLTSLDVSNWDTKNVTNMGNIFMGCTNLGQVDVSGWQTGEAIKMGYIWYGCSNLTSVGDLSGWDTSKCTDLTYMFYACSKLALITGTGNWDTSNVTAMHGVFRACSSLTSVDVSGWKTPKVTTMRYLFDGCKLSSLDLANWDTSSVTDMGQMFQNCTFLTSLKLGEGFGKMKDAVGTLDLSSLSKWTDESVQTLLTLYDRKTNGMGVITIKLSSQTKAVLGEDGIATLTAKGYTIA